MTDADYWSDGERWSLYGSDCRHVLPLVKDASVDFVLTDPPYPEVDRSYGRWTEAEWFDLMRIVVPQCMRVLKPKGSAVFILQPNSERVGRMRTWLWEFMVWVGKEWGIVQDAWWWNVSAQPTVHTHRDNGLMRPSLKACVWLGLEDCYRDQSSVLWTESESNRAKRFSDRYTNGLEHRPSGFTMRVKRCVQASADRGGVTPFNVFPIPNANSNDSAGAYGHGAGTPEILCDRWLKYACPPGGTVLDPFAGTSTVGRAALRLDRRYIGIEQVPEYAETSRRLLSGPVMPLFEAWEGQGSKQGTLFDRNASGEETDQ